MPFRSPAASGDLLGVLLVGSSRQNLIQMLNFIRILALMVGGGVIVLGLILGWWISARVTRPIEELAAGAREVAAGHWQARMCKCTRAMKSASSPTHSTK